MPNNAIHNSRPPVAIRGEGIAGLCCAYLLNGAGFPVVLEKLNRPRLPAIMLGETTQKLFRDVFQREDLFAGFPRIRKRVVAWGANASPLLLPHSAVVVSEQELLGRILQGWESTPCAQNVEPKWTIHAASRPSVSVDLHFGSRMASAWSVKLNPGCDDDACWIESLEHGWLFLLPSGAGTGSLLSVGESPEGLLSASRLVVHKLAEIHAVRGTFPSYPRIVQPLSEPGWLACGTAAVGFDPLCGDGAGNAMREAILAAAVVGAAHEGIDVDCLVSHYRVKVIAAFNRHLHACIDFYKTGGGGPWWQGQLADLQRGLAWCFDLSSKPNECRYRLNGFALETVAPKNTDLSVFKT